MGERVTAVSRMLGDSTSMRKKSFFDVSGEVDGGSDQNLPSREEFQADVRKVQDRVLSRFRGLIHPRSKRAQVWDVIVVIALGITCFYTPFEVALLPTGFNAWFVFSQVVNAVFIMDVILTFFRPLPAPIEAIAAGHPAWITSHRAIACIYLTGSWFYIDVISTTPFEIILFFVDEGAVPPEALKPLKMLRLLRLLKLGRIAKASRILSRWEDYITITFAMRSLIFRVVCLVLAIHWFSCAWCLLAMFAGSLRTDELQQAVLQRQLADDACTGCVDVPVARCQSDCLTDCEISAAAELWGWRNGNVASSENWICRFTRIGHLPPGAGAFEKFMVPLADNGFLPPPHRNVNFAERCLNFILYFISLVLWSQFTGAVCGAIANIDPYVKAYRNSCDSINAFMKEHRASEELRLRVREYLRHSRTLAKKNALPGLLGNISHAQRHESLELCTAGLLLRVSWITTLEKECQQELATRLCYVAFAKGESILHVATEKASGTLYVINEGVAARVGNILTEGSSFGEDMILSTVNLRIIHAVNALTYIELATLPRASLDAVISEFPTSQAALRVCAAKMAMARAALIIHSHVQAKGKKRPQGVAEGKIGWSLIQSVNKQAQAEQAAAAAEAKRQAEIAELAAERLAAKKKHLRETQVRDSVAAPALTDDEVGKLLQAITGMEHVDVRDVPKKANAMQSFKLSPRSKQQSELGERVSRNERSIQEVKEMLMDVLKIVSGGKGDAMAKYSLEA